MFVKPWPAGAARYIKPEVSVEIFSLTMLSSIVGDEDIQMKIGSIEVSTPMLVMTKLAR